MVNPFLLLYFSPRHVCEELGVDWASQFKKIKADPVFFQGFVIITIPSAGGNQAHVTLPAEMLSGWLTTIRRISDPRKQLTLTRYRYEYQNGCPGW